MELKEILFIVAIAFGVLMLKGLYDAFAGLNIPPWAFIIVTMVAFIGGVLGLGVILLSKAEKTGADVPHFGGITFPLMRVKNGFTMAIRFWLNWPAWVIMLLCAKVLEPIGRDWAKSFQEGMNLNLDFQLPLLGISIFFILSIAFSAIFLILVSVPFFIFSKGPLGNIKVCPRCGSLNAPSDGFCSNCGSSLPGEKIF